MTAASPDPSEPGNPGSGTQTNDFSPVEAQSERFDDAPPVPSAYGHYPPPAPASTPDRRDRKTELVIGGIILLGLAVVGFPFSLVWQAMAPRVELVATDTGFRYTTESPEGYIGDDGVFTFLGLGVGVVAALIVWLCLRRFRGPIQVTALVLGSLACQIIAWRFGEWWGRLGWDETINSAKAGDHLFRPPKLLMVNINLGDAWDALIHLKLAGFVDNLQLGAVATMALAAVFMYTVLAGWSRYQTLSRETEPTLPTMQTSAPDAEGSVPGRLPS